MLALTSIAGNLADPAYRLLTQGQIRAGVTLLRAQVTAQAQALGADDTAWRGFTADEPRFSGAAGRLLIEGQRTNNIRNARFAGGSLGLVTGSTNAPTNMSFIAAAGITAEIIAFETFQGLPSMIIEFGATGSGSGTLDIDAALSFTPSTTYTMSMFIETISVTSAGNISLAGIRGRTDTATALNGTAVHAPLAVTPFARYQLQYTTAADATAGRMRFQFVATGAATLRLRMAAPQWEVGTFASTPILPPVGTPGASTRGAEFVSQPVGTLFTTGAGSLIITGRLSAVGGTQTLAQLRAGSEADTVTLIASAGAVTLQRSLGGATASVAVGTLTAGEPFRAALVVQPSGQASACLDGGAVVTLAGGPMGGWQTLRLGGQAAGVNALFGELRQALAWPFALADSVLPELTATLAG